MEYVFLNSYTNKYAQFEVNIPAHYTTDAICIVPFVGLIYLYTYTSQYNKIITLDN
jgi:hypothetical protein